MSRFSVIKCDPQKKNECTKKIVKAFEKKIWVELLPPKGIEASFPSSSLPAGSGIIISSSGSIGGPHYCLQPIKNLNQSALASGNWLKAQGINPKECLILNSLPLYHVSGFMPWWRHLTWNAKHHWISPSLMNQPFQLERYCRQLTKNSSQSILTSLVPTQLKSLINDPYGSKWLQSLSLIWVGGSSIPADIAEKARNQSINLAPCYGATETAAMVTALSPQDFLTGNNSVGSPLEDIEINISHSNLLKIKTSRLAISKWRNNQFESITDSKGWWEAGDLGEYLNIKNKQSLRILGRRDSAINSGGETVFPEQLQLQLMDTIIKNKVQVKEVFLLGADDNKWGQRIAALIRFKEKETNKLEIISFINHLIRDWEPAKKPSNWYDCPELARNVNDKWEIKKWRNWLISRDPIG